MAVVTDFQETRISNRLIVSGLIWGLAFRIMGEGSAGVVHYLVNISIPVILLFLLFRLRALGAGDIKLFSVAGGFLSTRQLLFLIPAAILAAGGLGIGKLVQERKYRVFLGKERTLIHFSLAIFIGYYLVVWGCAIESFYSGDL